MSGVSLEGISWVRLSFVDVFGTSHSVHVPAARFDRAVEHGEPFDGSALEGRARQLEADMLLRPDPHTLVPLGQGLARALCTVLTPDGAPWPGDPRMALQSMLQRLGDLGEGYRAAAELEFYLLDAAGAPLDRGGYFDETEGPGTTVARAAADRLGACGIVVDSCHHEAGPGQYELDLDALGALELADALVLAKQVVREVVAEAGLRATFMPRPFPDQPGSGLHVHQRMAGALVEDGRQLGSDGQSIVAGQLAHARGLTALAAPTVNSYKRLHSGPEAPSAAVWAHVNRAALVRVSTFRGRDASIEFRGADSSANPYLLLTGLLAAAGHGLEAGLELPPPCEEDLAGFDPAASVRVEPLPRDLDDALDALLDDDVLVDAFDGQLLARLVDARRAEAAEYRRHVTSWERDRYLDEA